MEFVERAVSQIDLKVVLSMIGVSLLILIGMGRGNRHIVFFDSQDMFWTGGIILFPVLTYFFMVFSISGKPEDGWEQLLKAHPWIGFGMAFGFAMFLKSIFTTIFGSIRYNGILVGLFIGIAKIFACILILAGFLASLTYVDRKSGITSTSNIIAIVLFGVFYFIADSLINGDRVTQYREESFT